MSDDSDSDTEPFTTRLHSLPHARKRVLEDRFLTGAYEHPAATGRWLPSGYVGSGGDGVVGLWCQVDPTTNRVVDRMVVKQVTPGQAAYEDPNHWKNDMIGGTPLEFENGIRLFAELASTGQGLEKYITRSLGFSTPDNDKFFYKLYFDYCAYGTVYNIVRAQRAVTKNVMGLTVSTSVPEPFIWYFLKSMVKVAVSMESIGMVHKDLQAGNVLFDSPDSYRFAMYPTPKMADFGNSRCRDLQTNAQIHRDRPWDGCCQPFAPPELHTKDDGNWTVTSRDEPEIQWVTAKTNIWQIGMLALCLMRGQAPIWECCDEGKPKDRLNFAQDPKDGMRTIKTRKHNRKDTFFQFSEELYDLVDSMLEFRPSARPSPSEVLQTIDDVLEQHPRLLRDMDTFVPPGEPSEVKKHEEFLHIMSRANEYRLGKVFPGARQR